MYSRRTKSSTLAAAAVILLMSFTSLKVRGEDPRRNDGRVERLRAKFSAAGVETPPAPPADLGVHTACVKFGLACPDPYVKFLTEELAKLQGHAGGASHGKDEEEEVPTPMAPPPGARKAPKPPVMDNDPTHDAKLERLRRLRNVYRDKLLALHTTQTYWGCLLPHIKTITHRVFLLYTATVMQLLCSPLTLHIFFAAIIMTVLTWILFGTHIPEEHMCCIRATKPVFAMEGLLRSWGPPKSVANLVIERELCSIGGDAEWIDGTSTGNASDKEASCSGAGRRSEYWDLIRFALLEAYDMYHMNAIVLKLRLVLCLFSLFLLLWTVISLPLRAVDLKSGGFIMTLVSGVLPDWVPAAAGLHFAWSCVGGLVAFACWETFAAGEMLCRLNTQSAALCDNILKEWNWKDGK